MSKFARVGPIPPDFDVVAPTLDALDDEIKRKTAEVHQGRSRAENQWLVPQIDWQRTRYVHDLYYKYERISKECYDYCVRNKIINSKLSSKWLERGYERLCSLHAIDPKNFQFGGTSICRVPRWKLREDQKDVASVFNGCRGCASGKGAGADNIFGNKYGQRLAAIQIRREELEHEAEEQRVKEEALEREREKELREEAKREKEKKKKEKKEKKKEKERERDGDDSDHDDSTKAKNESTEPAVNGNQLDGNSDEATSKEKDKKKKRDKDKSKKSKSAAVWATNKDEEDVGNKSDDEEEEQAGSGITHGDSAEGASDSKRLRQSEEDA